MKYELLSECVSDAVGWCSESLRRRDAGEPQSMSHWPGERSLRHGGRRWPQVGTVERGKKDEAARSAASGVFAHKNVVI
jgi:hypothetical protein